jgi:hypothetical protein
MAESVKDATSCPRVSLFLDGWMQPRWVELMLRDCISDRLMTIDSVVLNSDSRKRDPSASRLFSYLHNWRSLPYAAFLRLDARELRTDPFASVDLRALCEGSTVREVTTRQTRFSDYFEEHDLEWLRGRSPDVALRFGFRILRGDVLRVPKAGVWSFHHGDNRHYRGGPAGFWEVIEGAPYTGAILQRLSEELDDGGILYRTNVSTHPVSVALNREALYWAASRGLSAALRQLCLGNDPLRREGFGLSPYGGRMYTTPAPGEAIGAIARVVTRRIRRALTMRRRKLQWHLGYRLNPTGVRQNSSTDLSPHRLRVVPSPLGSLWADPFSVRHEGKHWVFFEEIPPGGKNGHISVLPIGPKGELGEPRVVLARPHHLSYPCVFCHDGKWYMTPESYDAGRQELFVAKDFPFEWTLVGTFFEGDPIVDPTIFEYGGKWWLMGSRPTPRTLVGEELHAWFADSPLGPWTSHPLNPLRAGSDGTRPAGIPFTAEGRFYRPGQLGSPNYGAGVRFFEIEELTPTGYRERVAGEILPRWSRSVHGYHTINAVAGLTVGDLLIDRRE